jgi:hypothetical protein
MASASVRRGAIRILRAEAVAALLRDPQGGSRNVGGLRGGVDRVSCAVPDRLEGP